MLLIVVADSEWVGSIGVGYSTRPSSMAVVDTHRMPPHIGLQGVTDEVENAHHHQSLAELRHTAKFSELRLAAQRNTDSRSLIDKANYPP